MELRITPQSTPPMCACRVRAAVAALSMKSVHVFCLCHFLPMHQPDHPTLAATLFPAMLTCMALTKDILTTSFPGSRANDSRLFLIARRGGRSSALRLVHQSRPHTPRQPRLGLNFPFLPNPHTYYAVVALSATTVTVTETTKRNRKYNLRGSLCRKRSVMQQLLLIYRI